MEPDPAPDTLSALKTILKLLIALAILNAAGRGAVAAFSYYQFRDATEQLVLFGARTPPSQLQDQILTRAAEYDLPVAPDGVVVQREGARTWAEVAYTQPIEFFPRYVYPVDFSFSVDAFATLPVRNGP